MCRFVSGFQKRHLFLCTTNRNGKNVFFFQKCDVITFTCFFCHCTGKNKDIALKFCMRIVCMYLDHIRSFFWRTWKFRIYGQLFLENLNFDFGGSKLKDIKNPRKQFYRAFNFTPFGVSRLRLTSKLNILADFKHLLFLPQNGETWRH